MTCAEFRHLRDTIALETYRARWPILKQRETELLATIRQFEATENAKVIKDAKFDRTGLYYRLQDVQGELLWMELDAMVRKANLEQREAA